MSSIAGKYNGSPIWYSDFTRESVTNARNIFSIALPPSAEVVEILEEKQYSGETHYYFGWALIAAKGELIAIVCKRGRGKGLILVPWLKYHYRFRVVYPIPLEVERFYADCCICHGKPIYRVGKFGYCSKHRAEAMRAQAGSRKYHEALNAAKGLGRRDSELMLERRDAVKKLGDGRLRHLHR